MSLSTILKAYNDQETHFCEPKLMSNDRFYRTVLLWRALATTEDRNDVRNSPFWQPREKEFLTSSLLHLGALFAGENSWFIKQQITKCLLRWLGITVMAGQAFDSGCLLCSPIRVRYPESPIDTRRMSTGTFVYS